MDNRPTRATVAGQAYLDLQNLARRTGQVTQQLLQLYALEGFLVRLATSEHVDRFVLKGGVLLAAFNSRRPSFRPNEISLSVDVNVGDPIWPAPSRIGVPKLLGGKIELLGYPIAMIYAEKIVTMIQRSTTNTR